METSAKTGMNVDLAFMAVAKYVKWFAIIPHWIALDIWIFIKLYK